MKKQNRQDIVTEILHEILKIHTKDLNKSFIDIIVPFIVCEDDEALLESLINSNE